MYIPTCESGLDGIRLENLTMIKEIEENSKVKIHISESDHNGVSGINCECRWR